MLAETRAKRPSWAWNLGSKRSIDMARATKRQLSAERVDDLRQVLHSCSVFPCGCRHGYNPTLCILCETPYALRPNPSTNWVRCYKTITIRHAHVTLTLAFSFYHDCPPATAPVTHVSTLIKSHLWSVHDRSHQTLPGPGVTTHSRGEGSSKSFSHI